MKSTRDCLDWRDVRQWPRGRHLLPVWFLAVLLLSACTWDQGTLLIPGEVPTPTAAGPLQETAQEPATPVPEVVAEKAAPHLTDLETGFTPDGYPYMGSSEAPIVLLEYSDFHCPYCQKHNQETLQPFIDEFIRTGEVQYVARDLPLESLHPQARGAHRAAWCVALQSTDAFWWMHEQLYATQSQHARSQDAAAFYRMLAEKFNESQGTGTPLDVEAFATCQVDLHNEVDERIDSSIQEAQAAGINGTPTFIFFYRETPERALPLPGAIAFDTLAQVARNLDEFMDNTEAEAARADELPYWITDEGLVPAALWLQEELNKQAVAEGVTKAGDYFLGSPFAEVIVFEFSDFQCPYCQKHFLETHPYLEDEYVATNQVMWVFKHFPLAFHTYAPYAAEAAMCAGEQGRFWQMHDLLFAASGDWAHADYDTALREMGSTLGLASAGMMQVEKPEPFSPGEKPPADGDWLTNWSRRELPSFDVESYADCLAESHYEEVIAQGMEEVSSIIRGTPTFLIWHRRYGALAQPIVGSLEKESFGNVFDQIFTQLATLENAGAE